MAAQENGSEQQLELGKDVSFHPPSSSFFSKGLCLMLWKNIIYSRNITSLQFADGLDALAEEEQELEALV